MIINILSWFSTILCIGGNALVIKKHKNGFLIWFFGTGILLIFSILRRDWPQTIIFIFYEIMNIVGYLHWNQKED